MHALDVNGVQFRSSNVNRCANSFYNGHAH